MKTLLLAACVLSLAAPAQAQRFTNLTGAKLVELCTSKDRLQVEQCNAYIEGISDTTAFYQRLRPADGSRGAALPAYVCIPAAVTGPQLRETVVGWLRKNAGEGTKQASGIVLRAIDDTYLCPGEAKKN